MEDNNMKELLQKAEVLIEAAAHRSSSATDWGREMKKGRRMQRLPPSCAEVQSA